MESCCLSPVEIEPVTYLSLFQQRMDESQETEVVSTVSNGISSNGIPGKYKLYYILKRRSYNLKKSAI